MERDHRDRWDLLVGVIGDLSILVGDRVLYQEPYFPIVELALGMLSWLQDGFSHRGPYESTLLDSEDVGMVWIHPHGAGWQIGSIYQQYAEITAWSDESIRSMVLSFATEVRDRSPVTVRAAVRRLLLLTLLE